MKQNHIRHPSLTLLTCILASSLAFIDSSVVNVGLPAISHNLSSSASGLQWIVGGYLLPLSTLLMFGGALGDHLGRRRILIVGIATFGIASLGCGLAPNLTMLIMSRIVQGVGAAMLIPCSLAILGAAFDGEERGRAIGFWAAAGAAMAAIGPVVGGWLIDALSWRMIFFVNLPLGIVAVLLALRCVEKDTTESGANLDLVGAALVTSGLAAVTWALIAGMETAGSLVVPVCVGGAGVALLCAFVAWEGRRGPDAMMPLALFGSRMFVGLNVLTMLLYGALSGVLILLPEVLIESCSYSSTMAGIALLPLPIILSVASPLMGRIAGRIGGRPLLIAGPLVVAIGLSLMLRVTAASNFWMDVLPALVFISGGMACAVAPLTTAVLASVDGSHTGSASGLNNAIARTGGLIATALLGRVLASHGQALTSAFHLAMMVAAGACLLAALSGALANGHRDRTPGEAAADA